MENHIQHPTDHDEYQTRIRPSAFGIDLAECYTRIHSVDFDPEGVYRTRILRKPKHQRCERYVAKIGLI